MLELTTSNNTSEQKQILELILKAFIDLRLTWNEQVITQIKSAEITFEDCRSSYFFDFSYHADVPKLQVTQRVPVLIDFCSKFWVENETTHKLKNHPNFYWIKEMKNVTPAFRASDKANSYISAYLHILDGKISELEVVNWNGQAIDPCELHDLALCGERLYRANENWIASELSAQRFLDQFGGKHANN